MSQIMNEKRPFPKRIKYWLLLVFVRALLFLASICPRRPLLIFCGGLGALAFRLLKDPRQKTINNLTLVYGKEKTEAEIEAIGLRVFKMIGKNAADVFRSVNMKELGDFKKVVEVVGEENLKEALASKKGVIVLSAHVGAFEMIGTYLALMDLRPQIIGKQLKDPKLNALMMENRSRRGAEAIERGKDNLKVVRNLKSGGVVGMLIDQDTTVKSVFVDFMGIPAATPVGAALFALRTGAKVVPMGMCLGEDLQQHLTIYPALEMVSTGNEELDLITNTQMLSKASERLIQKDPLQWVWMHERWKTRPE
ncbi:Lipid A biosynthesis lauroyl acyltransferase [Mariniradius saccharolyticus AK6]|uniref:Lipid A biosynthesis lauroyl acyltransferase n=2 Tax=Mariniradius TaxID=1245590 RepID=M7X8H1_9BACT|nr:Lipid A biosynthesis lauroyl acyltransferase [Mariniradius saccharolyticus AK6]